MITITIPFTVKVLTDVIPTVFTYENEDCVLTDGSVTTFVGDKTIIVYTLDNPSEDEKLSFVEPIITNNFQDDVSFKISTSKHENDTLSLIDNGKYPESVGLRLVVKSTVTVGGEIHIQKFASPDPQIKARYRD